jgi:DNA-binding beta-propeller fold protein YncE
MALSWLANSCLALLVMETHMNRRSSPRFGVKPLLAALPVCLILSLVAQGQAGGVVSYATLGNPITAVATLDGKYVIVSVTNVGAPNFTGPDSVANARHDVVSGLQIFREADGALKPYRFLPLGTPSANGLALLPDGKTIVVGVGDAGVAFVNVQDLIHSKATPYFAGQGPGAGTFDVVVSPDGRYVFSANEYGVIDQSRGNIGIIAVHADPNGRVAHPETIGQLATGDIVPSLALSGDGSRLYVASELVPAHDPPHIVGGGNALLTKEDCVQKKGTPARPNGFISVIDTERLIDAQRRASSVLSRIAAGCSPVRLVETANSSALLVSARGDNVILAFSPRLLESDPEHALLHTFSSNGEAPVGVRLFAKDRMLAVANSNRFADAPGNAAIFSIGASGYTTTLQTLTAGGFPRNITLTPDGRSLYLTNYTSRVLQVISTRNFQPAELR